MNESQKISPVSLSLSSYIMIFNSRLQYNSHPKVAKLIESGGNIGGNTSKLIKAKKLQYIGKALKYNIHIQYNIIR